jgi:sarcosine oxidase
MLAEAGNAGAELRFDEPVTGWRYSGQGITVTTEKGNYETDRLLLAAGSYGKPLLDPTGASLSPKRVTVHWAESPPGDSYALGRFPVNFWQVPDGDGRALEFYSLPYCGADRRVKVAVHYPLPDVDLDAAQPGSIPEETARIRAICSAYLPELAGVSMSADVCLYTMTPDGDFYLGPLPEYPHVCAVALAGHGFKFAPVLGEGLADLLTGIEPAFDFGMFAPGRFSQSARA